MSLTVGELVGMLVDFDLLPGTDVAAVSSAAMADRSPGAAETFCKHLRDQNLLSDYQLGKMRGGRARELLLGNYLLLDKLGMGSLGMVYKAWHRLREKLVSIKFVPPSAADSKPAITTFFLEMEPVAKLQHANLLSGYVAETVGGLYFLAADWVPGEDLASRVRRQGPLTVADALRCIRDAALGMEFAHKAGVLHRDLKPGNLLLDEVGVTHVLDLGLMRMHDLLATDDAAKISLGGLPITAIGLEAVDFMAPELALNIRGASPQSDIYSLGCLLAYLLTGQPPYSGATLVERLIAHREAPYPQLSAIRSNIPPTVQRIFELSAAKTPAKRFRSMAEMAAELDLCLALAGPKLSDRSNTNAGGGSGLAAAVASANGIAANAAVESAAQTKGDGSPSSTPVLTLPASTDDEGTLRSR